MFSIAVFDNICQVKLYLYNSYTPVVTMIRMLFFLCMVLSMPCFAQLEGRALLDSLVARLPEAKEDTNKVKLLSLISTGYRTIDPDAGIKYGKQQLELATAMNQRRGMAAAYNSIGVNYQYKSDYTKALEYFNKALAILVDYPTSNLYGNVISHLAVLYQEMGDLDKSLEYNLKALDMDLKAKDSGNIAGDYGNIGIIYLLKKDYRKALEYDDKSLHIFEQLKDNDGIARNYGNQGNVYKEYGNYVKALEYDMKALDMFSKLGDNGGVAINLGNIGGVYIAIAAEMDSTRIPGHVLPPGSRGEFLAKAVSYLKQSIELSKKIGQLDNLIEFSLGLHDAYKMMGDHAGALASYKEHVLYRDSVYSQENRLKMAALETERELLLKDKQIQIEKLEVAQKRNERIILIIAIVLLLVVIVVVVRKFQAQTRYARELSAEKAKHLARIERQKLVMGDIAHRHSHDVSGHVATILGLVEVFNAEDYTDPDNKTVLDGIGETAARLDLIVKDMIMKENQLNSEKK